MNTLTKLERELIKKSTWGGRIYMTDANIALEYISKAYSLGREEEKKRAYEMFQRETNKYFIDPLFPNLKVAVTEILFKVFPESVRVGSNPNTEKEEE